MDKRVLLIIKNHVKGIVSALEAEERLIEDAEKEKRKKFIKENKIEKI